METTAKGTPSPLESLLILKWVPTKVKCFVGIHFKTQKSPEHFSDNERNTLGISSIAAQGVFCKGKFYLFAKYT